MSEWKLVTGVVAAKVILAVLEFVLLAVVMGVCWWLLRERRHE